MAIEPGILDSNVLFIYGHFASKNEDKPWWNDPELTLPTAKAERFFSISTGEQIRDRVTEDIRKVVDHDYSWNKPEDITHTLVERLHLVTKEPEFLNLGREDHKAKALDTLVQNNPSLLRKLSDEVARLYIYDTAMGYGLPSYMGQGRVSKEDLQDVLPHFAEVIESDLAFRRAFVDSANTVQANLQKRFAEIVQPEDIHALADLVDYEGTQSNTSSLVEDHWDAFEADYDGLKYTNCTVSEQINRYPVVKLDRDFGEKHTQLLGTVKDLIREGEIKWPKKSVDGMFKSALRSFVQAATDPRAIFAGPSAMLETPEGRHDYEVQKIRNDIFGRSTPKLA